FFSKPTTQSAIGLYIVIVGIVYSVALRKIWNPEGLQLIADRLLHDLIPLLYLIYWLLFTPKKVLQWKHIGSWVIFPAIYLIYSLARGAVVNWYPYYFINAQELGYGKVAITALLVLAAFILLGLLLVFINRLGKTER
ncbi:MAG: Pr6Pr family membrane protein, partial [Chitinophagaceae bacterium]